MTSLHSASANDLSDAVRIQQGALPSSLRIGVYRSLWALRQLALSPGLTLAVQQKEHWLVRSSILRKVLGRHAAGQLAQMELQAGPCARSHLGFDDLPPFITGALDLKVPILCCLLLLLEECELSEHFLKAVLNCILLLLNIKLL